MSRNKLQISKSSSDLIPQALTTYLCDTTFMNSLRQTNTNKVHNEHRIIQVNKCPKFRMQQVSHVFEGEPFHPIRPQKTHVQVPSNVMFNDAYFEHNPNIKKGRLLKYKVEKEIRFRRCQHTDKLHMPNKGQYALQRKIKENYSRNPLALQIDSIDQRTLTRQVNRTENLVRCNSSIQMKRSLKSLQLDPTPTEPLSKITNDEYQDGRTINQSNCYQGRKHFRIVSVGNVLMYC